MSNAVDYATNTPFSLMYLANVRMMSWKNSMYYLLTLILPAYILII